MTVVHRWVEIKVEYQPSTDGLSNTVTSVIWRLSSIDDDYTNPDGTVLETSQYGVTTTFSPEAPVVINIDSVTTDVVTGWLNSSPDAPTSGWEAANEAALAAKVATMGTSPKVYFVGASSTTLPFVSPTSVSVPTVLSQKFKIVLASMPSYVNAGKTLLDDAEALVAAAPITTQLRWQYPQFYRNDVLLNQMAALIIPSDSDPSSVLDQVFMAAQAIQ